MKDLAKKATQEKYFNSIRYFAHTLPKMSQRDFILNVAYHNIHLAAQCVMSGQEDTKLEAELKRIAEQQAMDFKRIDKSAQGFLALVEFESFEVIISLFSSLKTISSSHNQVISTILRQDNEALFYRFLDILYEVNQSNLIQHAFSTYNGLIHINPDNKALFKKICDRFIKNSHFGTLRLMLAKFQITDQYVYISNKSIEESINRFINNKKYTAINLAYELINSYGLLEKYPPSIIVSSFLNGTGKKGVHAAIRIAEKHDMGKVEEIIENISKIISYQIDRVGNRNKSTKRVKGLLKKEAGSYLKKYDLTLYEKAVHFVLGYESLDLIYFRSQTFIPGVSVNTTFQVNPEFESIIKLQQEQLDLENIDISYRIQKLFEIFFTKAYELRFEQFVEFVLREFQVDLFILNKIIRKFVFFGTLYEKQKHGFRISCNSLKYRKALFLHDKLFFKNHLESEEIGMTIRFIIAEIFSNFSIRISLSYGANSDILISEF